MLLRTRISFTACVLLLLMSACRQNAHPVDPVESLKISVSDSGLYRLDAVDLQASGFPPAALQEGTVQLTEAGSDVPFIVEEDGLTFYGRASTSRYTPVRTYILRAGPRGQQMAAKAVGNSNTQAAVSPAIQRSVHLEQNLEYVSDAPVEGPAAPWFWQTIGLQETEPIEFDLHVVATGAGVLRANLVGITHHSSDPDHSISMLVNGDEVAQLSWDGQSAYTATVTLPEGTLRDGQNQLQFQPRPKDYLDISKLDWIEIQYDSQPVADDDQLDFSAGPGAIVLQGFSEQPLVVDVTDPHEPAQLTDWQFEDGVASVTLEREATVVAAAGDGFLKPTTIEPLREADWDAEEQQADLLMITTEELAPALEPLVAARTEEGLSVALVPVEEVYDTFGYGAETPDSINRFVKFAYQNWQSPAPRYLLLIGDATTDYWGFLSARSDDPVSRPQNVIPPYLVPVSFGGETVSDARLADVDGDFLPELSVGRWPVASTDEVHDLVRRTLAYERQTPLQRALFVADGSSNEFERVTDAIIAAGRFTPERHVFLRGPAAGDLATAWQEGAWLVTYTGHGSLQLWSKDGTLSSENIDIVNSIDSSPIVVQLTCLTGLFAHPEVTSLSEAMLTQENGPALVIGATSLTLSLYQEPFAAALMQALQDPSLERVGDALQIARGTLDMDVIGLREINDTFVLLGDPSARIARPQQPDV